MVLKMWAQQERALPSPPDLVMEAHASKIGWDCIFLGGTAMGRWIDEEARTILMFWN